MNRLAEDRRLFWISFTAWLFLVILAKAVGAAQFGFATYFTVESCRKEGNIGITASGIKLHDTAYVCALPNREFGKSYRVCLADDPSRCVVVTHLDFGPGKKPRSRGVVIDLSRAAFEALAPVSRGKIAVTVEAL